MSSLIGTLFKSTTGLNAYTQGLDNLSTNVANLNTPGYKGKELQFRELADQNPSGKSPNDQHQGVEVTGASYRFIQGDTTETGNATDLAINGNGFFVLNNRSDTHQSAERKGAAISELFFTRAGQFQFDDDGFLIDPSSGLQVNALNEEGELEAININELNISLPEPTTEIRFSGNLNSNTATGGTFPDNESDTALTATVIDSAGREQNIEILFTKEVGNHWRVGITHEEGDLLTREQPLSFRGDGSPILDGPLLFSFQPHALADSDLSSETFNNLSQSGALLTFYHENNSQTLVNDESGELSIPEANAQENSPPYFITRNENEIDLHASMTITIDEEGYLINEADNARIAGIDENGRFIDLDLSTLSHYPATPTELITLSGNLVPANDGDNNPTGTLTEQVDILNEAGETERMTLSFQQITNFDGIDTQWSLTLLDEEGETVGDAQTLRFNDAGDLTLSTVGINGLSLNFTEFTQNVEAPKRITLDAGESSPPSPIAALHINEEGYLTAHYDNGETLLGPKLALVQKTGDAITDLALNFGSAGDFSQVTGFSSSNSTLSITSSDGRAMGTLASYQFDDEGLLTLNYSNGETIDGPKIALASILNLNTLVASSDTLFQASDATEFQLGYAQEQGLGRIEPNAIELSNVELSKEFSDIIVVQRGYQATSQVLSVTNEMIETLYNTIGGGR